MFQAFVEGGTGSGFHHEDDIIETPQDGFVLVRGPPDFPEEFGRITRNVGNAFGLLFVVKMNSLGMRECARTTDGFEDGFDTVIVTVIAVLSLTGKG